MTPAELKAARKKLGMSAAELADVLLLGRGGGRSIRRWEAGDSRIPGPAEVAINLLLQSQLASSS